MMGHIADSLLFGTAVILLAFSPWTWMNATILNGFCFLLPSPGSSYTQIVQGLATETRTPFKQHRLPLVACQECRGTGHIMPNEASLLFS